MAQPIYLDPELQGIERQRQLAQALMQRGMKPVEGQMVSGRYVAPAWTQQLANMFDIYAGRTGVEEAEKKAAEYQTRQQQAAAQNIAEALKLSSGTPEQVTFSAEEVGPTRTVTPATAANPQAAIARLLRPNASAVEQNVATKLIERQFEKPKFHVVDGNLVNEQGQIVFTAPKDRAGQVVETASGFALVDTRSGAIKPLTDASGQPLMGSKGGLPEGANKQVIGATNLKSAIDNYKEKLKNFKTFDMANPNARAEMGNAYNNMMLQAKEAYNLGVLNGPDYQILQSVVKDPTSMSALLVSKGALEKQANDLSKTADTIIENAYKTHNKPVPNALQRTNTPPPPKVNVPTSPPAGIDAKTWQFMTPEEKALWSK